MSLTAASSSRNGEPDAKKFRYAMPAQTPKHPLYDMNQNQGSNRPSNNETEDEKSQLNGSAFGGIFDSAEPSSFSGQNSPHNKTDMKEEQPNDLSDSTTRMESESSVPESPANLENRESVESPVHDPLSAFLEQAANIFNANFKNINKESSVPPPDSMPKLTPPPSHQTMQSVIPGALAVAASPAAQLFNADDWSWHRNPAASIRSGGTNKQTPVWKYFVYNKTENLSRCIIGDCTYILKGPHTSTLACHLKKHPAEYAEFQRLKVEYTRDRNTGSVSANGSVSGGQRNGRASSAASNGSSNSHETFGCNNKQGSSSGPTQNGSSPPANNAPTMVHRTPSVQPKSQNKKAQEQLNPISSIFGANPLLSNIASNMSRQPSVPGLKNPSSMNELLNSLSARAAASLASQQNIAPCSSSVPSHNSPINTPTLTPTSDPQVMSSPMNLMNFFKQSNGIFGPPAANSPNFDQKALLQQQSKKWPRHERKQRELETKLALALCSLQIPLHKLNDPFLRDFIESAQPKFQLLPNGEPLEQILSQMHSRALTNMKTSLGAVSKLTLMINAVPNEFLCKDEQYQGPVWLCISVAYYSQTQQVESVLLGVRKTSVNELTSNIRQLVSKVFSFYGLNFEQISHTILDGFEEIGIQSDQLDLPNQLRSYRHYLLKAMNEIVDASELYAEIQTAVKRMIQNFCIYPEALMRLSRLCGSTVVAGLQQMPFEKLAQLLLEIRESFLAVCCQQPTDQFVNMISESQWVMLDNILRLKRTFNTHMEIVQDNAYSTIDRVVPSIMQLLVTLEKDFPLLEPLPEKLTESIRQKLAFILDPQVEDFDSSFIQATALNPQLVVLLDEQQLSSAKTQIEKTLTERTRTNGDDPANKRNGLKSNGGLDALLAAVVERKSNSSTLNGTPSLLKTEDESNESVVNSASSLYPDLVQAANQRRKQNKERTQNGKNHYIEAMIQAYFDDALNNSSCLSFFGNNTNGVCSPLQTWQMNATKCPQLSELALELLSTPSSAILPEFILNPPMEGGSALLLDEYSSKHPFEFVRSGRNSQTLERDAIIRFNRTFWQKAQFP